MKYVLLGFACHNSTVSPRRLATAGLLALAAAAVGWSGCRKETVDCTPPPAVLPAPEAGCPTFAAVFSDVFTPVCDNCHAPKEQEASIPLTTYAQIQGRATTIYNRVFLSCDMPPSNAPAPLTADERQLLLDWFACGALNDAPATDASAGN
jgi:uncharacterized membrane protein